jgi:hypothetical protein
MTGGRYALGGADIALLRLADMLALCHQFPQLQAHLRRYRSRRKPRERRASTDSRAGPETPDQIVETFMAEGSATGSAMTVDNRGESAAAAASRQPHDRGSLSSGMPAGPADATMDAALRSLESRLEVRAINRRLHQCVPSSSSVPSLFEGCHWRAGTDGPASRGASPTHTAGSGSTWPTIIG